MSNAIPSDREKNWMRAGKRLARHTVAALQLAKVPLTLLNGISLLTSIPIAEHGELDLGSDFGRRSYCVAILDLVEERHRRGELSNDEFQLYMKLGRFFYCEHAHLARSERELVVCPD